MKTQTIKKGCGIILIILIVLIIGFFWAFNEAFGEKKYSVTIEQNIGGKLICDVTYSADLQSWYYFIDYKYENPKGEIFDFGKGLYQGVEWNENDQLFEFKNWTILPTETDFGSIKIISFDLKSNKKSELIIEPHSIQKDSIWKSKNIESVLMWSPSKVELDTINKNKIKVKYTFRIDRENPDNLGTRLIEYELDSLDGIPKMKSIRNKK
ncbi:hypothetical protein [Gelidibacter maritimus]|uniref:Uncharacterized protein n=1 Tax=Gelidibacter maritimus TaxID=2761487 RepID=A0A7W2M946_9FLAO|nr:hypothetical protein [Gelidibacter maritimus]MBA6154877.1 hypothetical protein [Gelidibacter maritimus]